MAELKGGLTIRKTRKNAKSLDRLRSALTFEVVDYGSTIPRCLKGYRDEEDGSLTVPRVFGFEKLRHYFPDEEVIDLRPTEVYLKPRVPKVKPRDYQVSIIDQMVDTLQEQGDLMFKAGTGMGKTVMSIIAAMRLQVRTLILVDTDTLRRQWVDDNLIDPTMFALPAGKVGSVGNGELRYKGCEFVVATVQSVVGSSKIPADFYDYFGLVIYDEAHTTAGAEAYSQALFMINSIYRLGVTATPRKKGSAQGKITAYHIGDIGLELGKEHRDSILRVVTHETVYSYQANFSKMKTKMIDELVNDMSRNDLIARMGLWLYESGRDTLILSDRVMHLQLLRELLKWYGVPADHIGLYVGSEYISKVKAKKVVERTLDGLKPFKDYTPVEIDFVKRKVSAEVQDDIKANCKIILATYNAFDKGVDVPRLAGGIDATPRAASAQPHGRILRPDGQKKVPIWATIRDSNNQRLEHLLIVRLIDYMKSKAEVQEWDLQQATVNQVDGGQYLKELEASRRGQEKLKRERNRYNVVELLKPQQSLQPDRRYQRDMHESTARAPRLSDLRAKQK